MSARKVQEPEVEQTVQESVDTTVLMEATPVPVVGSVVVYEGFDHHDGRPVRHAFPAIVETVDTDNPESAVTLSYLHRAQWHYVSHASFGTDVGCWHFPDASWKTKVVNTDA